MSEQKYDSVPRQFGEGTKPPTKKEIDAMDARHAAAMAAAPTAPPGAPAAPGPYPAVNTQLTDAPGVYGYYDESKRFGLAETIDAILEVATIWNKRGHEFGVGDISKKGGGDIEGHASHEKGIDFDVRLMREDQKRKAVDSFEDVPPYSHKYTQELIDLFWSNSKLKVQFVFFNDPKSKGTREWPNHDNHFHVRFFMPGAETAPPILERGNDLKAANTELQRCLNFWKSAANHPGEVLVEDGEFGQRTYDRLIAFQTAMSISVDGKAGPDTWKRLPRWETTA